MLRKNSILLLDNNEIEAKKIQRIFEKKLGSSGSFHVCCNGQEGLRWLDEKGETPPAVILMDLSMPVMSGTEFITEIKKDEKLKSIPVIVFTNSNNQHDIEECYQKSVAAYIVKPTENQDFVNSIQRIIEYWGKCELPN